MLKLRNIISIFQRDKSKYDVSLEGINLTTELWDSDPGVVLADYNQVTAAKMRAGALEKKEFSKKAELVLEKMRGYFPDIQERQDAYRSRRMKEREA